MPLKKLFIHATNIHRGGGRSLLDALLRSLPITAQTTLLVDSRMPLPENITKSVQIKRVKPTIAHRFMAECELARNVAPEDIVLCFGNLPPLFKLRGRVVVFMQNRYLIDDVKLNKFPLLLRLRLVAERLWLSQKTRNADKFIVQTLTMKKILEKKTQGKIPVHILPFVAEQTGYSRKLSKISRPEDKVFDFLYVASGEPYKNHRKLIEAWCLLAQEGIFPSLKLTLDPAHFGSLCSWIGEKSRECRLKVENSGGLSHSQVMQLYGQAGALIYPSTFESFGLPLIEARQAGLPVLASELDYVRDVVDPEQTFDPESTVSIARAVKRFLGTEEPPLPLQNAREFLEHILESEV